MDRSKVEEILKKYAEDYDVQSVSAENYIREHESDLRDRFLYAEYLEKPVNKKQIMFWNGNQCTYDGVPREVFEDTYRKKGKEYSYVWVIRNDEDIHPEAPLEITYVKKNTPEYWEALAVSGYLIGDGNLPVPYVKREEQFYANVYHKQEKTGIDTECLYEKELFKMDYLFQKPEEKEKISGQKKKILFFVNWKEEREHRCYVKALAESVDTDVYDVMIAAPRMMSPVLEEEFETLSSAIHKFIYRGRLTVTKKDFCLLRILEKHPELYAEHYAVREFIEEVMGNEWRRIWGKQSFDFAVLAGRLTVQQYFMACALDAEKKVVVDIDFLSNIKEKTPEIWEKTVSVFDKVYDMPILMYKGNEPYIPEFTEYEGQKYLICDKWKTPDNRINLKLLPYPEVVMNEYVKKYLPVLPAGKFYYEKIAEKTGSRS